MDFPINSFLPQLDLGTTYTAHDLNDESIDLKLHEPLYLMKFPYKKPLIDPMTFILFLGTFNSDNFIFEFKKGLKRKIDKHLLDCRIIICQIPDEPQENKMSDDEIEENINADYSSDNDEYVEDDDYQEGEDLNEDFEINTKKFTRNTKAIFKILFDSAGNYFYIQILSTSSLIRYDLNFNKLNIRCTTYFTYSNPIITDESLNTLYKIQFPLGIVHKISILLNKKNARKDVNQFTSLLFLRIAPFHKKTIHRNLMKRVNPTKNLSQIFDQLGGFLVIIPSDDGQFTCDNENVEMFAWFNQYFDNFLTKGTSIELDTTFRALNPFVAAIPQIIVNNTGVPLCILVGSTESSALYSLFFESLHLIDPTDQLYDHCLQLNYVTDEHKSFNVLKRKYGLTIYHCFAHLIRSVGAKSALALLLRDILYTYSKDEFEQSYIKFCYTYLNLYEIYISKTTNKALIQKINKKFQKIGRILGIDVDGNSIEVDESYLPLYERIERKIPTTTNYAESYHQKLNSVAGDKRYLLTNRLAIVAHHIQERLKNLQASSTSNLQNYIRNLRKKAEAKVAKNPDCLSYYNNQSCNCKKAKYYSTLYNLELPCIHMVLNEKWLDMSEISRLNEKNSDNFSLPTIRKELKILPLTEFDNSLDPEEMEEEEIKEPLSLNNAVEETKMYEKPLEKLIYHIYRQMKSVCNLDKINISSIVFDEQAKMLLEEKYRKIMQECYDQFLAILQVRTWMKIYELKNISKQF